MIDISAAAVTLSEFQLTSTTDTSSTGACPGPAALTTGGSAVGKRKNLGAHVLPRALAKHR